MCKAKYGEEELVLNVREGYEVGVWKTIRKG